MKKIVSLLVICMLLVIVGCGGNKGNVPTETPYVGGKTALKMSFVEGSPPEEIFDASQSQFRVVVRLENVGEQNIDANYNGYVEIKGINPTDYISSGTQANLKVDDLGVITSAKKTTDGTVLSGDKIAMTIPSESSTPFSYLPNIKGNIDGTKIRAEACYNYRTRTTTQLCIKGNLLENIQRGQICEVSGVKTVYNSGAPIQITTLREEPVGANKIQVTFKIAQVGETNDRFYKDTSTKCDDSPTNQDRWKVKITADDVSGKPVLCSGLQDGYVTLWNGEPRDVVCTIDVAGVESEFLGLLIIDLDYKYSQFIEKPMVIKDVTTETE